MNNKLKARQEARKGGCVFMNDRDKGNFIDLECHTVTLEDAYKLRNDDGEYWAFIVKEEEEYFYFANASLAQILNDAESIAAEDNQTIAQVLDGTRVYIGAKEKIASGKNKGKSFRPVDIVD